MCGVSPAAASLLPQGADHHGHRTALGVGLHMGLRPVPLQPEEPGAGLCLHHPQLLAGLLPLPAALPAQQKGGPWVKPWGSPPLPLLPGAASPDLAPWALQVREEYQKWARMVTGNKYSDFATSTSSSSHNQTRVRANPGVGCRARGQPWARISPHWVPLSRSSGHPSLACDYEVLARPAAPVASAAFAHTEDCPSSPTTLLPPVCCPREGASTLVLWRQTQEHSQGGVGPDGPASGCLCCTPAGTQGGQELDRAAAPCPGTQHLDRQGSWPPTHLSLLQRPACRGSTFLLS